MLRISGNSLIHGLIWVLWKVPLIITPLYSELFQITGIDQTLQANGYSGTLPARTLFWGEPLSEGAFFFFY